MDKHIEKMLKKLDTAQDEAFYQGNTEMVEHLAKTIQKIEIMAALPQFDEVNLGL